MKKLLISLLLILFIIVVGFFISLRFFPKIYIDLFNHYSSDKILIEELGVNYFPLGLEVGRFDLNNDKGQTFVSVDEVMFTAQLFGWLQGKTNFWKLNLHSVTVEVSKFPKSSDDVEPEKNDSEESNTIIVHKLLSGLNVHATDIRVQLDETRYLHVNQFSTDLNDESLVDYRLVEQDIDLSFDFVDASDVSKSLHIEGLLQSRFNDGESIVNLNIASIDLNTFLNPALDNKISDEIVAVDEHSKQGGDTKNSKDESDYDKKGNNLSLNDTTVSSIKESGSDVEIKAAVVQSSKHSAVNSEEINVEENDVEKIAKKQVSEAPIDWAWLSSLEPLSIDLNVGEILWSKSSTKEMTLKLSLTNELNFDFQSRVAWLESGSYVFDDVLKIDGRWKPIASSSLGVDLRGETKISIPKLFMKVDGDVNLNGNRGNALNVVLESSGLPVNTSLDDNTKELISQYFPINADLDLAQSDQVVDVHFNQFRFGDSDLRGDLSVNTESTAITAILESDLLSHQSIEKEEVQKEEKKRVLGELPEFTEGEAHDVNAIINEKDKEDAKNDLVFTDEAIDWTWLDALTLNFNWQVKKIDVDGMQVDNFVLPLVMKAGALELKELEGFLGDGSFEVSSNVIKKEDGASIELMLDASDIALEDLNVLPSDELKEAVTNAAIRLTTQGQSLRALAETLNGNVNIAVGDGIISNSSFELIGSDLILGLLQKLNPFAKENKTTELECAIVNMDIENGKVTIDKSVAVRTTKLTIVADGDVDLNSEKIKLSLTPKARHGVGVDVSSLVKFVALGGKLAKPAPRVSAAGLLESALVVGAAVSTGGASLVATNLIEKTVVNTDVCMRASKAFSK